MQQRQVGDISIARVIESVRPDFDAGQVFPASSSGRIRVILATREAHHA